MSHANRLLSALSPDALQSILVVARAMDLPRRKSLYQLDQEIPAVYFLTEGACSIVVSSNNGEGSEIDMVGRETVVGALQLLGTLLPVSDAFMQLAGAGLRVGMADMRRLFRESEEIRDAMLQAVQQQALGISQVAACNNLHSAEQRIARWLLTAADRIGSHRLALTQEFLSEMLGTRRSTVALVGGTLQRDGIILQGRGSVTIMDRPRLEQKACGCYAATARLLENLYCKR